MRHAAKGNPMTNLDRPQINLISPPDYDPETGGDAIARILDAVEIACLRVTLATRDELSLIRAADHLRHLAHARDVAVVIDTHLLLVEKLGLDGVHLADGARQVRKARKDLGADAIIGAYCGQTRHEGITAGEGGADYVAFGPLAASLTGDGAVAEHDLFAWWSEMIEVPVVAEGGLTLPLVERFAPVADHFAFGPELWSTPDPLETLRTLTAPLR